MIRIALLALLAAAACKGDSDKPLEPAVFGKVVAPPGDLGKLSLGMPIEQAKQAAPSLIPDDEREYRTFPAGISGVKYGVGLTDDRKHIDRITMVLPDKGKEVLTQAWGAGHDAQCSSRSCTYWFHPDTGMRGRLEPGTRGGFQLEFSNYLPIQKLFAPQPAKLSFETKPLLGATIDELRQAYPTQLREEEKKTDKGEPDAYLEIPPTELAAYWTRIHMAFEGGKVRRFWFDLPFEGSPTAKQTALAAMQKSWGTPLEATQVSRTMKYFFDPAGRRRVSVDDATHDDQIKLEVTSYLPAEMLLGPSPEKLGFEEAPLLGATWDDIAKAYPQYVPQRQGEEPQFALPPTEWGSFVTLVHFDVDDQKKVKSFRFEIPFGPHPAAKDTIKAALQKKYGGPGRAYDEYGRAKIELRAAAPRVVAEDDQISKGWSLEVSAAAAPPDDAKGKGK